MAPKRKATAPTSKKSTKRKKSNPPAERKERGENELWFSKPNRAFKLGTTTMRGLNPALYKTVIIKATDADKKMFAKTFNNQEEPIATSRLTEDQAGPSMTAYQKALKGQRKGKAVHFNLQKLIDREKIKKSGKALPGRAVKVHPQSELIFKVVDKVGASMEHAELGVFYKSARVATRIDFTATHRKSGKRIIGELKTGYSGPGYTRPAFRLRFKPYTLLSLRDAHFLQLLGSMLLHKHTFPNTPMGDGVLVQTPDNATAKCYKIPRYILDLSSAVDAALLKNA